MTVSDIINEIGGSNGPPYCRHFPCQRTARADAQFCTECLVASGLGGDPTDGCSACFRHKSNDDTNPSRGHRVFKVQLPGEPEASGV